MRKDYKEMKNNQSKNKLTTDDLKFIKARLGWIIEEWHETEIRQKAAEIYSKICRELEK